MEKITRSVTRRRLGEWLLPRHISHPDFLKKSARIAFDSTSLIDEDRDYESAYMPDDSTKEHSRKMHYCAHRMHRAKNDEERRDCHGRYLALRDRIVVGNRKLIYKAVRSRVKRSQYADDLIGDCHIVLIQAVAAFNPWMGIRFSTYAYTCLIRAISRLSQKIVADRNNRAVSIDRLPHPEADETHSIATDSGTLLIDEYLREEHPLLTAREKSILSLRFTTHDEIGFQTLDRVGKAVGLSKERVRQVQSSALLKLRTALVPQMIG